MHASRTRAAIMAICVPSSGSESEKSLYKYTSEFLYAPKTDGLSALIRARSARNSFSDFLSALIRAQSARRSFKRFSKRTYTDRCAARGHAVKFARFQETSGIAAARAAVDDRARRTPWLLP